MCFSSMHERLQDPSSPRFTGYLRVLPQVPFPSSFVIKMGDDNSTTLFIWSLVAPLDIPQGLQLLRG